MVITDDNFATIVAAIEEGRRVFDNIKKAIIYLLSSNLGEVLTVFIASLFMLPLPLTAAQILWVNFLSDGFPALALGMDPVAPRIMMRKPNASKGEVLTPTITLAIIRTGFLIGICCLFLYMFFLQTHDLIKAQTVVFTALVMSEFLILQTVRQNYGQTLFANKYVTLSFAVVLILQLTLIYSPLNQLFRLSPLDLEDWIAISLTVGALFVFNHFVHKFFKNE